MIEITSLEPQLVAGMRRRGRYKEIAAMLPHLVAYAMSHKAIFTGPLLYLWHEKCVEEAKKADEAGTADIEICVPIAKSIPESEEIKCYELCGGKMARAVHKGPYQKCGSTYEHLFSWLEENNQKIVGPIREAYLNDPREVVPEEILTLIYAPIG